LENFKLFGFLGRLKITKTAQAKNLLTLLEATKIVTKELPNARLVLAGAGYEEMESAAIRMGLQKSVIYIGNIPYQDNPYFLRMCDVVVCPALSDGFCFLLAEASACGIPVVATKLGAHADRVVHGRTGLLTEPSAESIASAMVQILSDEKRLKSFGQEGRNHAARFTWEESTRKHMEIYEMLLSKQVK
jgi:glycosyltransferase involved in cell wall biosynthesis